MTVSVSESQHSTTITFSMSYIYFIVTSTDQICVFFQTDSRTIYNELYARKNADVQIMLLWKCKLDNTIELSSIPCLRNLNVLLFFNTKISRLPNLPKSLESLVFHKSDIIEIDRKCFLDDSQYQLLESALKAKSQKDHLSSLVSPPKQVLLQGRAAVLTYYSQELIKKSTSR